MHNRLACVGIIFLLSYFRFKPILDRDPGQWNMDDKTVELRRRVFWEVYSADLFNVRPNVRFDFILIIWQSIEGGRPPSIELTYGDCALPTYSEDDCDTQCVPIFIQTYSSQSDIAYM